MKLSDAQLSMILGEHANGQLIHGGATNWRCDFGNRRGGCILQVAYNEPDAESVLEEDPELADWFDFEYCEDWKPETFLAQIEENRTKDE